MSAATRPSPPDGAKIGLYGGSFDPVHRGHLGVAARAREAFDLKEVWFIPAHRPPHKLGRELAGPRDRVAMLELALADLDWARVEPLELGREGPSYTYDTVVEILARYADLDPPQTPHLHWILGGDNLPGFPRWYRAAELLELVTPIVMRRGGEPDSQRDPRELLQGHLEPAAVEALVHGFVDLAPLPGRSSHLRRDFHNGLRDLPDLPPGVEAYVLRRGLYGTKSEEARS